MGGKHLRYTVIAIWAVVYDAYASFFSAHLRPCGLRNRTFPEYENPLPRALTPTPPILGCFFLRAVLASPTWSLHVRPFVLGDTFFDDFKSDNVDSNAEKRPTRTIGTLRERLGCRLLRAASRATSLVLTFAILLFLLHAYTIFCVASIERAAAEDSSMTAYGSGCRR